MITDPLACSGMPDGSEDLVDLPIIVKNNIARLASSGALAGGTFHYSHGPKNVYELTGISLSGLGKIASGYTADLVLLDENFDTLKVIINGILKYEA